MNTSCENVNKLKVAENSCCVKNVSSVLNLAVLVPYLC